MKVLLLVTGGRGGSDFFQGLLDGHDQILQFPGILRVNYEFLKIFDTKSFYEGINMVTCWYKSYYSKPKKIHKTSFYQIKEYEKLLKKRLI